MPANHPSYVRLSDRNALGMAADVMGGSRWSIAGYDVKPYPKDNPRASQYADELLRLGVLEPASQAEFNEVQQHSNDLAESHLQDIDMAARLNQPGVQEAHIQDRVETAQEAIKSRRRNPEAEAEADDLRTSEVHHQEGSGEVVHEPTARQSDHDAEDEEGEPTAPQGTRRRGQRRA